MNRLIVIHSLLLTFSLSLFSFVSAKEAVSDKKLFDSHCASCHGPDAKGSFKMAKTLKADPIRMDLTRDRVVQRSDEDLQRFIASGHGRMPKQPGLTSVQIQSLIRYLRTLQKAYASK